MQKILFSILLFGLICCKKEDSNPIPNGNYYAATIIQGTPIRGFVKNATIDQAKVNKILNRDLGWQNQWKYDFSNVEFVKDTIRISSIINWSVIGLPVQYDYAINNNLISLQSRDTVISNITFSSYQVKFFNDLSIYSIPTYKDFLVVRETGYSIYKKYLDKKYIYIVDENTIRVPFIRYWNKVWNLIPSPGSWSPRTFNNRFNDENLDIINADDTLLIKEFEVEYRKK